jgi:acetylornithine deacetylase
VTDPDRLSHWKAQLAAAIDANWPRQVAWLQKLVRFESLTGHEAPCQDWLASEFASRGWRVDRYTLAEQPTAGLPGHADCSLIDPRNAVQVVATVPHTNEDEAGRSLILQGHVDVVPIGPLEMWSHPPFSGDIDGDWLYGRGAQDMKMGICANVFALDALAACELQLRAPVYVQTVTAEESSGQGALSALARGYRADACLIPESTGNVLSRAHTGTVWFKLRVRGQPVHVQDAQAGTNAILSAYRLIHALQELTERLNRDAAVHPLYAAVPNPIKFNPGKIAGGDWASSTPSWCEVACRLGILPGKPIEIAKQEIIVCVAEAAKQDAFLSAHPPEVIWDGFQAEGAVLAPSDAETVLGQVHRSVFGSEMRERLSTAVDDTRFYNRYDRIPALCYGPIGEGLHAFDERAYLPSLRDTTLLIALFIGEWCGGFAESGLNLPPRPRQARSFKA